MKQKTKEFVEFALGFVLGAVFVIVLKLFWVLLIPFL